MEEDLRRCTLVAALPVFRGASRPFSLLYPAQRRMPLRLMALIDFLVEELGPRLA